MSVGQPFVPLDIQQCEHTWEVMEGRIPATECRRCDGTGWLVTFTGTTPLPPHRVGIKVGNETHALLDLLDAIGVIL